MQAFAFRVVGKKRKGARGEVQGSCEVAKREGRMPERVFVRGFIRLQSASLGGAYVGQFLAFEVLGWGWPVGGEMARCRVAAW